MEVIVADKCGFCPGVNDAISAAEKILARQKDVYSLGPIIHNKDVVEKLAKAGLRTVDTVGEIPSGTVLIRSHGVAPDQLARIEEKGLKIVDATCVLVKRVQRIAIGDKNHPEVKAVVGCAREVVVVADESDLHKLPRNKKLGVVCQTTESPGHFAEMLAAVARQGFRELRVINTLCKEAVERQKSAVDLCKRVDVMFVLGGLESANTRKLAELCREYNPRTFHLQNWKELDKKALFGKMVAGVTAGASTPQWVITRFVENLAAFDSSGAQHKC
jgi:4-hydroxy-3-methylbut-2-enyl diphosphate reductase